MDPNIDCCSEYLSLCYLILVLLLFDIFSSFSYLSSFFWDSAFYKAFFFAATYALRAISILLNIIEDDLITYKDYFFFKDGVDFVDFFIF